METGKGVGDKALGAATKIGATPYLALRTFGEAAQTARQEGATLSQQALYGLESAISGAAIEKAFDGLKGLYGESGADKLLKLFKIELKDASVAHKIAKATIDDAGEGLERVLTDIADQLLKSVYNEKSTQQIWAETEWGKVRRDALIDTIAGILLGDTVWKKERN